MGISIAVSTGFTEAFLKISNAFLNLFRLKILIISSTEIFYIKGKIITLDVLNKYRFFHHLNLKMKWYNQYFGWIFWRVFCCSYFILLYLFSDKLNFFLNCILHSKELWFHNSLKFCVLLDKVINNYKYVSISLFENVSLLKLSTLSTTFQSFSTLTIQQWFSIQYFFNNEIH